MINNVGIIPDGNRRWARQKNKTFEAAYARAMSVLGETISQFFEEAETMNIVAYLLSSRNLQRDTCQLDAVLRAETRFIKETATKIARHWSARIVPVGLERIDHSRSQDFHEYSQALREAEDSSGDNRARGMYFLTGYDPVQEVLNATGSGGFGGVESLEVPFFLDLVLRTSGEMRLSNFVPLQSGLAELVFLDKYFPDLGARDVSGVILAYQERQRRFGL